MTDAPPAPHSSAAYEALARAIAAQPAEAPALTAAVILAAGALARPTDIARQLNRHKIPTRHGGGWVWFYVSDLLERERMRRLLREEP